MISLDWATVLDGLFDNRDDLTLKSWAATAIAENRCTPGQRRAYELLAAGTDIVAALADGPANIAEMVAGLPEEALTARSAPTEWNVLEIVHHLADNEFVNSVRFRAVLTKDTPELFGYDSAHWTRFFQLESLDEALRRWTVCRVNTVRLLRTLDAADLSRRGVLSYRGPETVRVLAIVLAGHDLDHVRQLRTTIEAVQSHPPVATGGHG